MRWGARLLLQTELTEAEVWSRESGNLDAFVLDLLGSDARKQRVEGAKPRDSSEPSITLTKSMPRSGHHLLMNLVCEYSRDGVHYCEFYGGADSCCHSIPCKQPYHPLLKNRLFLQKSHDHDHSCQVQGHQRSREGFEHFAKSVTSYYIRFHKKWIRNPTPRTLVLAYEDLLDEPHRSMSELVRFLEPGVSPRESDLQRALALLRIPSASVPENVLRQRRVEAYEFFDAKLYRDIEDEVFAGCPGLKFDRMF